MLEWVAIPFSRGSSWPRDWTQVSCIAGGFFTVWTTREAPENKQKNKQFLKSLKDKQPNKYGQRMKADSA